MIDKSVPRETFYRILTIPSAILFHMEQTSSNKAGNKQIGRYGEAVAAKYLQNKGFKVIGLNYLKKWGEIDVIAEKDNIICFIEVKTVSYETKQDLEHSVSRGTWKPEDNVHEHKIRKLSRAIDSWISEHRYQGDWQIDVVAVKVVPREKYAVVKHLPNIIL